MRKKKAATVTFPKFATPLAAAVWAINKLNHNNFCYSCERQTGSLSTGPCAYCKPSKRKPRTVKKKKAEVVVVRRYVSRSAPDTVHYVRAWKSTKEFHSCTCPGFKFRNDCRHKQLYQGG